MKGSNKDLKQQRTEVVHLKEEECKVVIIGLEDNRISAEVFVDASFGNVEDGRTQIGFYIHLKDGQ